MKSGLLVLTLLFLTLLFESTCDKKEGVPIACLPYEGKVIHDPLCWGIIVQVKNIKVSDIKFTQNGIEYDNIVQVMGIDSSILSKNINVIDSLNDSELFKSTSFFFDYREMTNKDESLQPPCSANVVLYSLDKKIVITNLSDVKCVTILHSTLQI